MHTATSSQGAKVVKAGANIRQLANQRKKGALLRFGGCFGLVAAPVVISFFVPLSPGLLVLIWVSCLTIAFLFYRSGQKLLVLANKADQGAGGEEDVAQLLNVLQHLGWTMEYNIRLERWGDADAFVRSPLGNCFVIDTKTNKGGVFFDGTVLKRRYGKDIYDFDKGKDLLKAVRGQAAVVKDLKQVRYVQPILCFTEANLNEINQSEKINGVYVVSATNLINLLQQLDR